MESGFSALAQVAGTLFGLVLISLVFAYSMAITRIDSISDFTHFASWVRSAGLSCFLYFSCCFLIAFRLMEDETCRSHNNFADLFSRQRVEMAAYHDTGGS
jgi:hypothetical protein